MERDPLLEERWNEKAEHEHGQEVGEKGIEFYYSLLERGQKNPDLKPLIDNLEKSIGDYADSVIQLSKTLIEREEHATVLAVDRHRTLMHNVLIDAVNAISRWYAKHHIDNKWRRDIIGLDRKDVGVWALSVARAVLGKEVEE